MGQEKKKKLRLAQMKGFTRRREWKEIWLGQKTSRERRGGEKGKKYAWCKRIA
jgi:hypothetical protein